MSKNTKLLQRMRNNPQNDWQIEDVQRICCAFDINCDPPSGGSHWTVAHSSQVEILTVPAHKPIKVVYIKKLMSFIDSVIDSDDEPLGL